MDNDPDIRLATSVLDDADAKVKLDDLFDVHGNINHTIDKQYRIGFEKMCSFLDRLAYAHLNTKTIEKRKLLILVGILKALLITLVSLNTAKTMDLKILLNYQRVTN